ncbi:membrane protein [Pseudidiomarina atlantica]|uniref:D-2-hydroxyglutarate dehydrogenase n=1 Tax=Pseudidiomarina atlantica TaxID=1517416 RepID=A0A094L4T2_9GAMM|nr:membrane protein [Pseudidiomarina atlantica]
MHVLDQHVSYEVPAAGYRRYSQALTQAGFAGAIEDNYASRLLAATDNSVYQLLPQLVIFPRDTADLQLALQLAQREDFLDLTFSPRGGGTGTNGQSLNQGIIIDLSRTFKNILEIAPEQAWVRCQTGVVKDALNDAVREHGLFFSPDLSTSNRATIGGMINTDASGQGSLVYGKTSDHILGLQAVLINGEVIETAPVSVAEAQRRAHGESMEASLYRQAIATCIGKRSAIEAKFPPLNRFLTGYDLKHCYDPQAQTIDLSRLLAGSEGTLAFITEAKLNLTAIPRHKVLVNISYRNFDAALRHAPVLVKARATSVETIDNTVLNLARNDIIWDSVREHLSEGQADQPMDGINMVEYTAVDQAEIDAKLQQLIAILERELEAGANNQHGVVGYKICDQADSIQTIYAMRKKAVGLLGAVKGERKPIAFAEDTAVPPESLADFISEFRGLLDQHELQYGMFGHVDAGVLHVRPALDMKVPADEQMLRRISDKVAALTAKYGGLMWGEHGKGFRSEYAPTFFGPELYTELQKIKAAFDPDNRLNPGKLATPFGHPTAQLVSVDARKRGFFDRQIPIAARASYQAALNCNGNGLCFNYAEASPMCPSYKVTGDRRNSPKGRATLIREWLRLNAREGVDVSAEAPQKSWFWRFPKRQNASDFNHQVKASMDACLACKACASECPVKVDVPQFRAKFLQWYYHLYRRPLRDYLVASVERTVPLMAKWPRISNALTHNGLSQWLFAKVFGYVDTPKLSVPNLQQQWQQDWLSGNVEQLQAMDAKERQNIVVIVQDPFTSFYQAEVVVAFAKVVARMGYQPYLLDFIGNGKALHVKGFLSQFRRVVQRVSKQLNAVAELAIPMVGLDAATVLVMRDEYREFRGAPQNYKVQLVHEWLCEHLAELQQFKGVHEGSADLLTHCTEQTAVPTTAKQWQQVFASVGKTIKPVATGCCGMAGTYGHEIEQLEHSKRLFAMSWQQPLAASAQPLATGFSCRCQTHRMQATETTKLRQDVRHPVQLLADLLS